LFNLIFKHTHTHISITYNNIFISVCIFFTLGLYSCQLTPLPIIDKEMSLFEAKISIQVSAGVIYTEHKDFTFIPSVFINKKELFFGQFSGKDKLIIIGLPQVLSQIKVNNFFAIIKIKIMRYIIFTFFIRLRLVMIRSYFLYCQMKVKMKKLIRLMLIMTFGMKNCLMFIFL